jgi:CheY-like chemotaxis protein
VGRFACLAISDTGTGIDAQVAAHIFEPFFTTKEAGKGTGLGLATVYGIVKQHRGWIELETEMQKGTTFRVLLPASQAPAIEPSDLRITDSKLGGHESLLLVEDEAAVRKSIVRALELLGYTIFAASTGLEAADHWATKGPDIRLLLTDMVMPGGVSGLDLAQRCLSEQPGLKVILMSGYSANLADSDLLQRHGVFYLPKPLNIRLLAQTVRSALDQLG